jgi:Fic family protein
MTASACQPPYTITPLVVRLISEISEAVGRHSVLAEERLAPFLRRENRIRSIHASLAIENNTLSLEQVTAVIAGKRVLGDPREIQEVRNAFAAYEALDSLNPTTEPDLLSAHNILMQGLVDRAGMYRSGGVGVFRGARLVHMAPPAKMVPELMGNLLGWLATTDEHPLVASSVFHYEFEFIHPFDDGNGRMGRLWQTLILRRWKPMLAFLPVETVIRARQEAYYQVLATADDQADATPFIEFMLQALSDAIEEVGDSDQVTDQVSDQVASLLKAIGEDEVGSGKLMELLGLRHRPTFRNNYIDPALEGGWLERTNPESPRSPRQKYRLTSKGKRWLTHNE